MGTWFSRPVVQKNRVILDQMLRLRTGEIEVCFREELVETLPLVFCGYANGEMLTLVACLQPGLLIRNGRPLTLPLSPQGRGQG